MPVISVIVPVFNVENYLSSCIDSILAQSFTDFELILIDDGSTDDSGRICDAYAKKDERVQVIHTENNGPGMARNKGLDWAFENSDSDWIAFIDSDDTIHREYLFKLYNAALKYQKRFSVCSYVEYGSTEQIKQVETIDKYEVYDVETYFCKHFSTGPLGKLFYKQLFSDIRFPSGKNVIGEDAFIMYKILFKCNEIVYNSAPLYYYYQSPNSLIRSEWTPAKLLSLKAIENEISFFEEKKYYKALKKCILDYAENIYSNIISIISDKNTDKYSKELKTLKKSLRRHIKHNKNDFSISNLKKQYLYHYSFPIELKFYWYWQAIKRRIRRNNLCPK